MSAAVADVLRKARALIETPERWWCGSDRLPDARCTVEAICFVDFYSFGAAKLSLTQAVGIDADADLADWNDERTHAEVLAAFDAAIAAEEATP